MTEVERVKADLEQSVKNIVSARAEDEKVSIEILSHAAVEIALELAILNDYLKGENNGDKNIWRKCSCCGTDIELYSKYKAFDGSVHYIKRIACCCNVKMKGESDE